MGQGVHFRGTTPAQRRLLFETWQATGDVEAACASAHVGRRTFYSWKGRFEAGGYAALEQYASRAPHHPPRTTPAVERQVIAARTAHPEWGKRRIADEVAGGAGMERLRRSRPPPASLCPGIQRAAPSGSEHPISPPSCVALSRNTTRGPIRV